MGIIKAVKQAIGGGFADTWQEVIEPDNIGDQTVYASKSPITAVVTTADICAIGIMEGARLGGYRVPIDLSVIGYDNLNLCQYTVPKLTSVSQNVPKKARLATELLLKKIHDNESDSNLGEIMDVEIVDRQSVISLY